MAGGTKVKVILKGRVITGQADLLQGAVNLDVLSNALQVYLRRFPYAASMHHIEKVENGSFNLEQIKEAARSLVLVRIILDNPVI